MKKLKYIFLLLPAYLFSSSVSAKINPTSISDNPFFPSSSDSGSIVLFKDWSSVQDIVYNVVVILFDMFFVVAVLFILLAAYNFIMGGSDEKRLTTAKNQLKWAVIAIVVALVAGGVSFIIKDFLGTAA